ncbi:MAG: long-chain-fatty-acid--CoA ligase [Thermoplasmata archaeon]
MPIARDPGRERPWLARYPEGVPSEIDPPDGRVDDVVGAAVRSGPQRVAIRFYGRDLRYEELWEESGRLATALGAEGVGPEDRVAVVLPNCPLYPIALLAAWRLGATIAQISPLLVGDDLLAVLRDARPRAVVTLDHLYPPLDRARSAHAAERYVLASLADFLPAQPPRWMRPPRAVRPPAQPPSEVGVLRWREISGRTSGPPTPSLRGSATSVALLQYTGGTTGTPKGAMLTHRNLLANATQLNAWNFLRVPGEEVLLTSIPLFHIYGLTVGLLVGLIEGDAIVLQSAPDVGELLELVQTYRPTQFPGVPALYQGLLRHPEVRRYDLRSIRYCLSGSAPLSVELQRRFEEETGARLIEGYGLSESSPATHANPRVGERREGSIGLPLPGTEERIVDLETGSRTLPVGAIGELEVRGPQVMLGYFGQPEETARALHEGWLRTGDVARLDADGFAYIVDRKKDMINVGGLKVWPREVEEVLFRHPAVLDAAVVGVPDPRSGEAVRAYVVRNADASVTSQELTAFVRNHLAHYKVPREVEFRDALPRSGVQKVLRRVLRVEAGRSDPPTGPGERG